MQKLIAPGLIIMQKLIAPGLMILQKLIAPGLVILQKLIAPGLKIMQKLIAPGLIVLRLDPYFPYRNIISRTMLRTLYNVYNVLYSMYIHQRIVLCSVFLFCLVC